MQDDKNRGSRIFSNFIWRFAERGGAQIVSFIVSVVLARILEPETYGTIALVTVFLAILQVFVDSGLGNALIQKKDADNIDFSTVFFANIAFCIILYAIMFLAAPFIGLFYHDMSLVPIVRALSLILIVSGVKNVQHAYVSRNMLFRKFFLATLMGTLLSGVIGIVLAKLGYGVWALIAMQLLNVTIDTIILWFTVRWRPDMVFSFERLKELFSYGSKILASNLLDVGYNNIWQLIIGKLYTPAELAYYNKGNNLPNVLVSTINTSVDSVLLPVMSKEQDHRKTLKSMTRRAIKVSTYVMAPLMMGMAFAASNIVVLLLTEKWTACIPYLIIFCITYMFYPINTANLNVIKAMGRSDIFLKMELLKKAIGIIILIITMRFGVMVMAYGLLVSALIGQVINVYPNNKLLDYGFFEQLKDIFPNIVMAVIMGIVVSVVPQIGGSVVITLVVQVFVGIVVYSIESVVTKNETFYYLLDVVKRMLRNLRKKESK